MAMCTFNMLNDFMSGVCTFMSMRIEREKIKQLRMTITIIMKLLLFHLMFKHLKRSIIQHSDNVGLFICVILISCALRTIRVAKAMQK